MSKENLKRSIKDMKGFKTPQDIWINIEGNLPAKSSTVFVPFYRKTWTVITASLILAGLILVIIFTGDKPAGIDQQIEKEINHDQQAGLPESTNVLKPKQEDPATSSPVKNKEHLLTRNVPILNVSASDSVNLTDNAIKLIPDQQKKNSNMPDDCINRMAHIRSQLLQTRDMNSINPSDNSHNLSIAIFANEESEENYPKHAYSVMYFFENEVYKTQNNIPYQLKLNGGSFFFTKHFADFYLQTGLSLVFSRDKGARTIQYNKLEKVGEYQYVDSVAVDPVTYQRSYFTIAVDIFDSVNYTASNVSENRYRYLQLPFYMGYNLYSDDKYIAGIILGAAYYKEINKQEVLIDFPYSGPISNTIPQRRDYNIQISAGINFGIKLKNHWFISLRPEISKNIYRWYISNEIIQGSGLNYKVSFGLNYTF